MTYQDILKQVNYPTDYLVLDFETYFDQDYTLSKMSTVEFAMDDRFEFTGLGLCCSRQFFPEGCPEGTCFITPNEISYYLSSMPWDNITVIVQNSKFDILILQEKLGITPPYVIDILDLARHYDARMKHDLDSLAKMFGLKPKGNTLQFKGLHYENMDEIQRKNLSDYCINDIEIENDLFRILLPLLSCPKTEIPLARHTLQIFLNPKVKFNFAKAQQLAKEMRKEQKRILEKVNWVLKYKSKKKPTIAKIVNSENLFMDIVNKALPEDEEVPMKQGKNKMIPAFAKDDDGMKLLLIHPVEKVRLLAKARLAVGSWPLHIKRIVNMTNQAKARNGYLGVPLHYYGGHTGRWSGAEKINVQNFGKQGRTGSGIHPLIKKVASLIEAPDGYKFIVPDLAQIEARILAWIAGQTDLLEGFANGEDVYSEFASELFQTAVYKPLDDDPEPVQKVMGVKRGFGKDSILGCGFGLGATKFYLNCLENSGLRPLFREPITLDKNRLQKIMQQHTKNFRVQGIENYLMPKTELYNEKSIAYLILKYRLTYPKIPEFWKQVEKSFRWVIKYPNQIIYYHNPNTPGYGSALLSFFNKNRTVFIRLPSGRELRYRHCRLAEADGYSTIYWQWGYLWGGSITENIVQAIARDVLAEDILLIDPFCPIVCHVHDSITAMVKESDVKFQLPKIERTMRQTPEWATGLPIDVKSKIMEAF